MFKNFGTENDLFRTMELSDDIQVLKGLVVSLLAKIEELQKENAQLRAENTELRNRLNINSQNSSLPPSKDLRKPKPAFTKIEKGKQGGQLGHQGQTLMQVSEPDKVEKIAAPLVCSCGCDVSSQPEKLQQKRQLFDLPQIKLQVTEYQQYSRQCPVCHQKLVQDFPNFIGSSTQYGKGVMALCSLLSTSFHLSCQQISQLFTDLYQQPLNVATVVSANARTYEALVSTESLIQEQIIAQQVVHSDETGLACNGKTHWLHTTSTHLWTYLFVHKNRGKKALQSERSMMGRLTTWLVHDCWASYFTFDNTRHALCNAHILRELQALIENKSQWATQMHAFLMKLYLLTDKGKSHISDLAPHIKEYETICQVADLEEPPPIKPPRGKPKSTKGRNLLNRLIEHQDSVLAFAKYDYIPFTNNQAERDIRPVKGKIKNAGCFRSTKGADHFARIMSFVSTTRKQNHSVFKELLNTLNGYNFITNSYSS